MSSKLENLIAIVVDITKCIVFVYACIVIPHFVTKFW